MNSLSDNNIEVLEYQELDSVHLEDITDLAFSMPAKTQAVIGIGGGDMVCKLTAYRDWEFEVANETDH